MKGFSLIKLKDAEYKISEKQNSPSAKLTTITGSQYTGYDYKQTIINTFYVPPKL